MRFAADRRQVRAHTFPTIETRNPTARVEHEATASRIAEDQLFLCDAARPVGGRRGLDDRHGFCKEVFKELPMEFAVEAQNLIGVSLEGSVG